MSTQSASSDAIAIIPARGGSKRIPRKNLRHFLGKPIISYSIESALASNLFREVMVSTDDQEIASFSRSRGASVPFLRSDVTSGDHASTADVLLEVLCRYRGQGQLFSFACCLYPTAPFVKPETLAAAHEVLIANSADSVVPVARYSTPIHRALVKTEAGLKFLWPEHALSRSQDLPATYYDSGQFYWLRVERFLQEKTILMAKSLPLEIDGLECQDIDNETDWALAELKMTLPLRRRR